jgi:hydrogenase-4 transcriptional activator
MSKVMPSTSNGYSGNAISFQLPLASMVRALCCAASSSPDVLYEVMLKMTLMVESTAQTYGLATFSQKLGEAVQLKWVEGLDPDEIIEAESIVSKALSQPDNSLNIKAGDQCICLVLTLGTAQREGSAIYGKCIRPISEKQAKELRILMDVAQLAHSHALLREELQRSVHTLGSAQDQALKSIPTVALPGMVFVSRAMSELAQSLERIKDSESTVLITGESGTGKELVARAVHRLSRRSQAPFIPFNCTAAPADLIESLLFGHRKGSFTGAHIDSEGLIRAAEGGTLFLDEIGDLPLSLQPKLLRFLQEGEVHTLGERTPRRVNVRVVAATHKNLEKAVQDGTFREDLYYRVASLSLYVPPLRERPEDIVALISHFLTYYSRRNDKPVAGITSEAIRILEHYSWPGNVRELAAEMERLVLYTDKGAYISAEHINSRIRQPHSTNGKSISETPAALENMLEDFERRLITETLKQHDYNVARTAVALGLGSRQTLYKKLKRLAINISGFLQDDNLQ